MELGHIRSHVDRLYEDFHEVTEYLKGEEPSMSITADESFRKYLLLTAASYFERKIQDDLLEYIDDATNGNPRVIEFVRRKAISRQYHTLFSWDRRNANSFWGLFGESFRDSMRQMVNSDTDLDSGIRAFLELSEDRNRLVHEDLGTFSLEKTLDEIYASYTVALRFVERLPDLLRSEF